MTNNKPMASREEEVEKLFKLLKHKLKLVALRGEGRETRGCAEGAMHLLIHLEEGVSHMKKKEQNGEYEDGVFIDKINQIWTILQALDNFFALLANAIEVAIAKGELDDLPK